MNILHVVKMGSLDLDQVGGICREAKGGSQKSNGLQHSDLTKNLFIDNHDPMAINPNSP